MQMNCCLSGLSNEGPVELVSSSEREGSSGCRDVLINKTVRL